jgi:hypothetical protein
MPCVLRSLTGRGVWAGMLGLALAAPVSAQDGPELPPDPIAASNRMTDPFHRPAVIQLTAADAPWLPPEASPPAPMPISPPPAPMPKGPPPASMPVAPPPPPQIVMPPQPTISMPVTWMAPARKPFIGSPLPTSDRPMIPCEPVNVPPPPLVALAPPRMEPPAQETQILPSPRPLTPEAPPPAPQPKPQPTMTAAADDEWPAPKPITTCRFIDAPIPARPAAEDAVIMAVIRRGGNPNGTAVDICTAVEAICRKKAVECQTEVAGERQVRVMLTVKSSADWQLLYGRLQDLPELGEYGLVFQVKVEK